MKAIYVDDERSGHINFHYDMKDRAEIDRLAYFYDDEEAIAFAQKNQIDCAFLDIELGGGKSGIDLADQLKLLQPNIEIVFITAYDQYAREAYRAGGRVYLTKPYAQNELDETIRFLRKLTDIHRKEVEEARKVKAHVQVRTFGNFDILVEQRPVVFKNAKAKELLAYLVHQRGGTVNGAQIFLALWENLEYSSITSTYVRRTVRALKNTLEEIGVDDILVYERNCYSVRADHIYCDYYELLAGNQAMAHLYNGEYMNQYSWGEGTIPQIERKILSLES